MIPENVMVLIAPADRLPGRVECVTENIRSHSLL